MRIRQFVADEVAEGLLGALVLAGPDGAILDANAPALECYGYSVDEIRELNLRDLHAPHECYHAEALHHVAHRGVGAEYDHVRKDGSLVRVEVTPLGVGDEGQRVLLASILDVAERSRRERSGGAGATVQGLFAASALRESEAKYRMLTENTSDVIWTLDPLERKFLYVSPSVFELRGYTPEEVMAQSSDEALTPESGALVDKLISEGFAAFMSGREPSGHSYINEVEQPCKDGSTVWTQVVATFHYNQHEDRLEVHGVTHDITERRRAEQDLRVYAELLDTSPAGITVHTLDGAFLYANVRAYESHGYTHDEFLGLNLRDLVVAEDAARFDERLGHVLEDGEAGFEVTHYRKDGSTFPLAVNTRRASWAGRDVILAVSTDITERNRAAKALLDSAEQHRTILETTMDGYWLVDLEGRLLEVNAAYAAMSGYTEDELLTMRIADLKEADSDEDVALRTADIVAAGQARFESRHQRKDGSVFDVEVSVRYQPTDGGRLAAFLRDITETKRSADRLARSLASIIAVVGQVVETRDPYTAGHERRVAELAVCIAQHMKIPAREVEEIRMGSLIHDVGKISVPAEILSKPGRLSDVEFALIKGHAESGFAILAAADMDLSITEMVHQHHERCDGSGYPQGLRDEEIVSGAKILMVADVVEAMTSHRPYRPGLGIDAALEEIQRGSGTQFDSRVVDACVECFRDNGFAFSQA